MAASAQSAAPDAHRTITWEEWLANHGPARCRATLGLWLNELAIQSATADEEQSTRCIEEAGTLYAGALAAGLLSEDEARIERQAWLRKVMELFLRTLPPMERRARLLDGTQEARFLTPKRRVAMLRETRIGL